MRNFLFGALLTCGVVAAMGSMSWNRTTGAADAVATAVKRNAPLRLADLTLDRLQRFPFAMTGGVPVTVPFPGNFGLVVDELRVVNPVGGSPSSMFVNINGVDWGYYTVAVGGQSVGAYSPPLLIRPGDTVTLTLGANANPYTVLLTGWEVFPGEV